MKITSIKIQQKNNNKVNVYVNGEYLFAVKMDFVFKYSLKEGLEISLQTIGEIKKENSFEEAFDLSLKYISKSIKTKKQIKDYLVKKGYTPDIVYKVLDRLVQLNYVNDVEYAKRFCEYACKKEGKRLSDFKLMQKGVKKQDIELAREEAVIDTLSTAIAIAEKRLNGKEITKELLAKTYRYLIGKGFSYEEAETAIKPFKEQ